MADRPIIFSAPMIRALLDGWKTQTRRILRHKSIDIGIAPSADGDHPTWIQFHHPKGGPLTCVKWPYSPGDRLYVREAFSYEALDVDRNGFMPPWYWADGSPTSGDFTRPKPSIHMPRWASRLTLTVTDVRVQRLQEISEADAVAEGIEGNELDAWLCYAPEPKSQTHWADPRESYRTLWNSLHGPDAWASNPWVAAISFTVRKGNIDA